ncbi:MAG: nucleoside diphosphate kinase regulator [Lysobacterales bacterium]
MHATTTRRPSLLLSRLDVERIEELLEQPQFRGLDTGALRGELERAEVAEPAAMPGDVITMNSVARVRADDAELGSHERELALVYPRDADGSAHKVSILAPGGQRPARPAHGRQHRLADARRRTARPKCWRSATSPRRRGNFTADRAGGAGALAEGG